MPVVKKHVKTVSDVTYGQGNSNLNESDFGGRDSQRSRPYEGISDYILSRPLKKPHRGMIFLLSHRSIVVMNDPAQHLLEQRLLLFQEISGRRCLDGCPNNLHTFGLAIPYFVVAV